MPSSSVRGRHLDHTRLDEFEAVEETGHRGCAARCPVYGNVLADGAREGSHLLEVEVAREVRDREKTAHGKRIHQHLHNPVRCLVVLDEVQDPE